jgi:secreted trypsin-like serine protease
VILGRNKIFDYEEGSIIIDAKEFFIHENFSMPSADNDIAIIELPLAVIFTNQIVPIKVSTNKNFSGKAFIAGWGSVEPQYEFSGSLKMAKMKIIELSKCIDFQENYVEKVTKNHICAVGVHKCHKKVVSPCNGDIGSPLVSADKMELIGITSFVKDAENGVPLDHNDCTTKDVPAVFVKISSYLSWISEKTEIKFD